MSLPRSSGFARAFGSALGLEALAIAALVAWVASQPPTPAAVVVQLHIESVSPEPDKPQPKPEPPKPLPAVAPVRKSEPPRVQPVLAATSLPTVTAPAVAETALTPAPASVPAAAASPPAALPPPPAPPPVVTQTDVSAYNARLTAAAQAAFSLPQVAIDLNFRGKARIGFTMRDGVLSAMTVVKGSGLGVVDRAALKAVQSAQFPLPPDALRGKEMAYLIWVSAY